MGGGRWKQHPRSDVHETLERHEAQESIEATARVTPSRGQRTPTRCQTLEPSLSAEVVEVRERDAELIAKQRGYRRRAYCGGGSRQVNGRRVAGVERRHGFVESWRWRSHLRVGSQPAARRGKSSEG
jgi:hypothetical protein